MPKAIDLQFRELACHHLEVQSNEKTAKQTLAQGLMILDRLQGGEDH